MGHDHIQLSQLIQNASIKLPYLQFKVVEVKILWGVFHPLMFY